MSTYTSTAFKGFFCRLVFPGFMWIWLFMNSMAVVAQESAFRKLQDQYLKLATALLRNQEFQVLPRYVNKIPKNIEISEELFKKMLSRPLSGENVSIDNSIFSKQELESQDYVPFKIERDRLIVSEKILDAHESQFFFYMTFMKIYSGLHSSILKNPNIFATGICALIAQEFTYNSTLAVLPRFFDETALANLLYLYDPEILQMPFDRNFNQSEFKSRVTSTLQKFSNIDESTIDSLFQVKENFEIDDILCRISPGRLNDFCSKINKEIHHLTVRFIIYNALQQCFSEDIARMQLTKSLVDAFREELKIRYGDIPPYFNDMRIEKNSFGALYQFIYNISAAIPDSLRAVGLQKLRLDDPALVEQKKNEIAIAVSKEEKLSFLLNLMSQPTIELRKKTDDTNVLGFQWRIGRKNTNSGSDFEFIHVEFVSRPIIEPEEPVQEDINNSSTEGEEKDEEQGGKKGGEKEEEKVVEKGEEEGREKGEEKEEEKDGEKCREKVEEKGEGKGEEKGEKQDSEYPKKRETKAFIEERPILIEDPVKKFIQEADLTKIKPPDRWREQRIHLDEDDRNAIKALNPANRVKFNFTHASFSNLNGNKRKEILRFIRYFEDFDKEQLFREDILLRFTQEVLNAYDKQKSKFLENPNIAVLRHMIQKFLFLSYISDAFGFDENVKNLNRDILEISLRTIFSYRGSEYEGYHYFADLKNTLVSLLKFIQDMAYFYHNPGKQNYADITIEISQNLKDFVNTRLTRINVGLKDPSYAIAVHEVVSGENKINLRNLIAQLDKIKYKMNPGAQQRSPLGFLQKKWDCRSYDLQIYDCILFADQHVITESDKITDAFGNCFSQYFSLQDMKKVSR